MKAVLYIVAGVLGLSGVLAVLRGVARFLTAVSSSGYEAQGRAVGLLLFGVLLLGVAWKALEKARAS